MRDDFRRLAHAGLTFNAPLSEERASALVAALPISPGHHVLDLGCGWGELLLRILAAHPASTGTGVDTAKDALDRGVLAAARRGLHERVDFVEAAAETFVDIADIVVCVGASHAFGGPADALHRLRQSVAPGGRASTATPSGRQSPPPPHSRRSVSCPGSTTSAPPRRSRASGSSATRPRPSPSGTRSRRAGARGSRASPDPEAVAFAAQRRREYEDGYRDAIGFSWLVLAPVVGVPHPGIRETG